MINTEVEIQWDIEFNGENEVEVIMIESDEEIVEKPECKRLEVLTPDEAFKLWEGKMKEEDITEVSEVKKEDEAKEELSGQVQGEGKSGEKEEMSERKPNDQMEVKKPEEGINLEAEVPPEVLPEVDEEAWTKYSHRMLRMLRHQIPNDYKSLQGPDGWVLLRDVNRAGIEITEEGCIALSIGIGGEGKIRFEIGECENNCTGTLEGVYLSISSFYFFFLLLS